MLPVLYTIIIEDDMKNDNHISDEDEKLKTENPIKYYLKHYNDQKIMFELRQENRELYNKICRLHYILSFQNKEPIWRCPECGEHVNIDEWGEEYCPTCGLVTRTHYNYNAGIQINLPYGIKL